MKFPLGGKDQDYDSKKSPERLINMIADVNRDGSYTAVKRSDGLTEYVSLSSASPRSNLLKNAGLIYVVSFNSLYRIDTALVVTNLGTVGGSGRAQILANAIPGDSQILVLNGIGDGFVYTNTGGLVQITDPDFFQTVSGTVLNERFWFARKDTNEFFGSSISDGLSYDPLTFGTAEESPDNVIAVIAKKSALWVGGEDNFEYWQSIDDPTLPLRRTSGTTKERGISASASLAEIGSSFAWLADDGTVRLMTDTTMSIISDLELELRIRGDGERFPGFTNPEGAIGFFVDGPVHKIYYLIFPDDNYCWGYDMKTKATHARESGDNEWRVNSSVLFDNKIICGDSILGKLWVLDPASRTENGDILKATIRSPTMSFEEDVTIPLIEIMMETGTTTDPDAEPMMMVAFTKDGGVTYQNHSRVSLGLIGEKGKRVPLRLFGRVIRNTDFGIELTFTDAERFQVYGANMVIEAGY